MNFVCILMSDSELLRIKNKQKASYKSRKTARSNKIILTRPNDRFGFNYSICVVSECVAIELCLALWQREIDDAIVGWTAAHWHVLLDFAESGFVLLHILLESKHQLLCVFRSHDHTALNARLWSVWRKENHVDEEIVRSVGNYSQVGVAALHFFVWHFNLNLLLLVVVVVVCHCCMVLFVNNLFFYMFIAS